MLHIRSFQETDRATVVRLWHDCDLVGTTNDPNQDINRKLFFQPDLFLVGLVEDKIVASIMAGYEGHRGWLNYLAVAPEFRRHGFGKRMINAAEQKLRELGCPKINLQVRKTNTSVLEFYLKTGFTTDEVVSMGKRLSKE